MPLASQSVLVIGADMAGLTVAGTLARSWPQSHPPRSQPQSRGRIHTLRENKEIVELGACFIHGKLPELRSLIGAANLETYRRLAQASHGQEENPHHRLQP